MKKKRDFKVGDEISFLLAGVGEMIGTIIEINGQQATVQHEWGICTTMLSGACMIYESGENDAVQDSR